MGGNAAGLRCASGPATAAGLGGLTAKGVSRAIIEAQTQHLADAPFAIDDSEGFYAPLNVPTCNLVQSIEVPCPMNAITKKRSAT
jgi:hypothetical protein